MKRLHLFVPLVVLLAVEAAGQATNPLRITCPPNRTNWLCTVASTAIVTYPAPTTTAGCPTNAIVTCTPPSGALFILGTNTVTCRATNSCRESAVCTFTVTVARDIIPPVIECPTNRIAWLCGTAVPDARVFWPPPIATDNADPNVAVTCSPPSGSLFPPGTTTVICTATDDCTNRTICTFTVTVIRDLTPPSISCPPSMNVTACAANGAVVNYPTPIATDNADPNVDVSCVPASGSLFPLGTTTVTCTATDDCTNRTICTFLIRVTRDTTPPVLQPCPSNIVVMACDRSGAIVNFPTPPATDNLDPSPVVSCSPRSGNLFPVGTTTVTCTATDDCTNRSTCTFTITVNADTTPPVIQCPSNIVLWTCSTSAITHYAVTATDDYDLDVKITCTPPVGTPLPVGNTIVRCVAEDDCGNTNQCSFQVQVNRDTTPPAIECPSNMVFNCLCPGNTIVLDFFKPTVTDNHDPNPTVVCVPPSLVSSPGVHPVTCTATDNCGNSNRCSFTVTFNYDTTPPALTCPTNLTVWTCNTTAVVNYSVSATDACDASVDILCTPPSGSAFPLGTTTVACAATDNCTNRSTCTFTVTVRRNLLYGGLCHSPLGLAALNVNANDELEISGFGASGQDGVRIDLGESQGLRWMVKYPSNADGDVDGRDYLIWQRHYGSSPAGAEILISEVAFASRNGQRTITPSAASYELKLLLRGQVVYRQGGRTGSIDIPECHHVEQEHCVGEEFAGLNPQLPYCINFLTVECDWETPSGSVRADGLVLTPEDPLPPFTAVSAIEIVGSDFPVLTLHRERLLMFGSREQPSIPHGALGQARLVADDGALALADLGSSGQDGVRIELAEEEEQDLGGWSKVDGLAVTFEPMPIVEGGEFRIGAYTPLTATCLDSQLGSLTLTRVSAAATQIDLRLRPCENWLPPTLTVFNAGQPVGSRRGSLAGLCYWDIPIVLNTATIASHELGFQLRFANAGPFRLPDGTSLTGDEIRVVADTATPGTIDLICVRLTGAGLPSFTIIDETPLAALRIACPPNLTVRSCSTNPVRVNFPSPVVTGGHCTLPATVTCVPPSGSQFPPGNTTVVCTTTNVCGERAACSFTVTVLADITPPVIQCPSNIVLWTCSTSAITHYAVTATDDYDLDVEITCTPPVGTPLPVGLTTVRCVAEDDCGNTSQCSFDVRIIRDTTPPTIECPSNMVFNCLCPGSTIVVDFFKPTVTDNHDPNPTVVCNPPSLVSSPGVHVVTCTATDNCGNSNRCSFTVTFNYDTTPPVITCPANLTAWTCNTSAVINFSVSATDTCDANVGIVCTPRSGSVFPLGTTTVACTATDNCTNRSTCTFTVTVNRSPETGAALDVSLQRGQIVVNWDERTTGGVLQAARDPGGPWFDVIGATAPYTTRPLPGQRFYRLNHCPGSDPAEPAEVESFSARAEADMGTWLMLPQSDWMFTRGQTWTHIRSGARPNPPTYRSMSGHFLVPQDGTPIAVFFSAEAYVDGPDKRLFVRALVDGEPLAPGDVVFATGVSPVNPESRAFVFTGRASAGLHTVEMQWLVDPEGTGYIRDAAYLVRVGDSPNSDGSVQVFTPPSGPSDSTTVAAWTDVPGLSGVIQTKAGESLAISVSAESYVIGGGTMFLRALVDGAPAKPSDVLFAKGSKPQCRLMTFGLPDAGAGLHNVRIQWQASGGGAFVGDRSLVLAATPNPGTTIAQAFVAPDSGAPESTSSTVFAPMPGMSATGKIPPNGEVAVLFSAVTSVPADESLHVRLTIDGVPVPESEVQLAESDVHTGVHSFVFSAKHLYAGAPPPDNSTVRIEWRVAGGNPVFLDDRSLTVLVKKPSVPDLAEPRPFGLGNFPLESAIGARRLLVILWDPHRPGHTAPTVAAVQQAVFGPADSIRHYYSVVSREKYSMNSALGGNTVLGWYDAAGPVSDYFDNEPDCLDDGTANGQDRRRAEALTRAAQDIDFASFDANRDGVLDPQLELGILLVIPDTSPSDGKVRNVRDANCDWLAVDGVIVPLIAEWMTDASSGDFMIGAHELAHMMLNLDDNYLSAAVHTEAGRFSLMELIASNHTPHPDALNKLALGWVSPVVVESDGIHSLRDVKKSGQVIILPRKSGKVDDEYYLLENRQSAADNSLYDQGLVDSGVAVWHIVESHAENGLPPVCPTAWAEVGNGNARRGNRLLRPQLASSNLNALWNANHYDLLDTGLVCPDDAADPADRRHVLRWADGTASGFNLLNWPAAAETMTFQILAP